MVDMSNDGIDSADLLAEDCERDHSYAPDVDCVNCQARAEIQHCAACGADYTDSRWWTALGSTAPNGCDHEAIVDDWDREIRCSVIESTPAHPVIICGDTVTTAGKTACDHHQRILDAEECGRIYQRLVAAGR